jgi:hypothetical protein
LGERAREGQTRRDGDEYVQTTTTTKRKKEGVNAQTGRINKDEERLWLAKMSLLW